MTDLAQMTALAGDVPQRLAAGALTLVECPDVAIASVARLRRAAAPALPALSELPPPGGLIGGKGLAAFWAAPGQWMVLADGRAEEDLAGWLAGAAPDAAITDQTDGFAVFDITSAEGAAPLDALLEKLVNRDPASLGPGRAARCALHHMAVFLLRPETDRLRILGMRSSAGSLWHSLSRAARWQADARRAGRP